MTPARRKPGRPPKSPDSTSPHMSEQIIAVAVDLFFENGYNSTSIRDIAQACNVTPGALYNHFPAKEKILLSIISEADRTLEQDMNAALINAGGSPGDQLRTLVETFVLYNALNRKVVQVSEREYKFLPEPERETVKTFRRRLRSIFEAVIQRGLDRGEFSFPSVGSQRAARLATVAIGDMCAHVAGWFQENRGASPKEIASLYGQLALSLVNTKATS